MKTIILLCFMSLALKASAQSNPSPNMGMPVPIPGVTSGPAWATDINSSLGIIDSHDHSPGKGVQVTPSGLNINSDLSFQNNNATMLRTSRFSSQSTTLGTPADLSETYVVNGDLYYNNGAGTAVRITNGSSIVGPAGSISGLPSGTASASYSAGSFIWQSATNTAATMDAGPYIFRPTTAGADGITVSAPSGLASNLSITLPGSLPASGQTHFMTINSSGTMANDWVPDFLTLGFPTSNNLGVMNGGIGTAQIAVGGVATSNIADNAVTRAKLAAVGQHVTLSSGAYSRSNTVAATVTNLSETFSVTGRPVMLMLQPDGGGTPGYISCGSAVGINNFCVVQLYRGLTLIGQYYMPTIQNTLTLMNSLSFLDTPSAGSYDYSVSVYTGNTGNVTINVQYMVLMAYEL